MQFVAPERYASLKATGKLPSPKGVAFSIIKLLQRDDYRIADLVQLVQSDPAIAGRILYFANAAAFGRSRPIASLQRAIVALGSFRVRDLVIGLSVMHSHKSGQCKSFDYEDFWGHSLATGIACQELAHFAQIASEEMFTIGLLSRVGELALASLFPETYSEILSTVREGGTLLVTAEQERLGMDHHELAATLLDEWGLPETLIQAAYHFEDPDAAGFPDGSRNQTLTLSLSFASSLAHLCMVDEASRWSLLPGLLARAARLGISGETLSELVDRIVKLWRDWGAKLQVRTHDIPPFEQILAATPPVRRMGGSPDNRNRRARQTELSIQLVGIPLAELPPLINNIRELGHQPVLLGESENEISASLRRPAQIVIADTAIPGMDIGEFCRRIRHSSPGKESYLLILATPEDEGRVLELVDAGADDVLIKPPSMETLRAHLTTAGRMLALREEMHRERLGLLRSTDQFAATQKRLLQDALTDKLTGLPNRRSGLDFLASEWLFTQTSGSPLAFLMLDIDHFKTINDHYGHAAGDAVLQQLATILRNCARAEDQVFRYGGEEFSAVLINAPLRVALQIGERIRSLVESAVFAWEDKTIAVTLSIGLAVTSGREKEAEALIRAADDALYQAKAGGRNRIVSAT